MLTIYYRILSIDPSEGSVIVRYWSDSVSEEELALDENKERCRTDVNLNIWDPTWPADQIHSHIILHAPTVWLEMKRKIRDRLIDTSLSQIKGWVGQVRSGTPIPVSDKAGSHNEVDVTHLLDAGS